MWYKAESTVSPNVLDTTSSQVYVFVRKNITETQIIDEETGETTTIYKFDESKIKKDVYDIAKDQWETDERLTDVEEIIADILFGGDEE